jgi:hypothetical protein
MTALLISLLVGQPGSSAVPPPAGVVLRIHTDELRRAGTIYAVAFAADGKTLLSASQDGKTRQWDTGTGRLIRRLGGHEGAVKAIALTPDGKVLATAGVDGGIRLWNPADGTELRRLKGHEGAVEAVACSPDGKLLASAGEDKTVRLWRIADGTQLHELPGHEQVIRALTFAPDGKWLASGSHDRSVRLWDTATGKEVWRFWTPGWIYSLSFAGDGKLLASGGRDQSIHLWELPSGKRLDLLGGYDGPVGAVALFGDGHAVAAGTDDKKVRLWQTRSKKLRRELDGHEGAVLTLALSRTGKLLTSAGADGQILIWEVDGAEFLWLDLGSLDESVARDAVAKLTAAAAPVAFLEKRLQPHLEFTFRVDRLIADLGSDRFRTRGKATQELEKLGKAAESGLREGLRDDLSLETRRRIEHLLNKLPVEEAELRYSDRLRISRAIAILERIGTPAARRLLETLAAGPPSTRLTREVQASLRRMDKRPFLPR